MRTFHVVEIGPPHFDGWVGTPINPPLPLSTLPLCGDENRVIAGADYTIKDYKGVIWAKSAPSSPSPEDIQIEFYYPLQESFFYDLDLNGVPDLPAGSCLPFNAGALGSPTPVSYSLTWPEDAPQLRLGESVLNAKNGLPDIKNLSQVQVVYDSGNPLGQSAFSSIGRIYDPLTSRVLPLPPGYSLPNSIALENVNGTETFADLPSVLKSRITYDRANNTIIFKGILDESFVGEPLLLPNVLSAHERDRLKRLDDDFVTVNPVSDSWDAHVDRLYRLTLNPNSLVFFTIDNNGLGLSDGPIGTVIPVAFGEDVKALAIFRNDLSTLSGRQFITLIVNNDPDLPGLPVDMKVIEISKDDPFRGDLKIIQPSNVFDERITIRHSSDFGGNTDRIDFEWYYHPGSEATDPPITDPVTGEITDLNGWILHTAGTLDLGNITPPNGVNQITLGDVGGGESGLLIMSDNRYLARYRGYALPNHSAEQWGAWVGDPASAATTQGVLVEGWVKRVLRGLNPFDSRTADFHSSAVDTFASMIKQAGIRYEGDIAFNPDADNINQIGLIEAYETVRQRAARLSINGTPAVDYSPANDALLLVTSKISDLYMLLGNEAYADAADPTIGFGTSSGAYGSLASSIFSFQNQMPSLLDEELTLLRGRDDSSTGVAASPVYNRLYWNFTLGEGEVAYQQNYNVTDQDFDGFINEIDARILYPQGHGDAWGHYLTAQKAYYKLLRHPNFTWTPRSESISVGGVAVEVDFLDERKFAAAAAARAKTGSEIVDLTYRKNYVESPSGQWQGYKDADADRAWGVDEWSRRVTQGAYFDWVTANFILPAEDTVNEGLAKIDRQTVSELREIPVHADIIRTRLENSNLGLNPLGLAQDVVPFDIDPSQIAAGNTLGNRSHYEQIQARAVTALKNAAAVWDEANTSNSLLRQNQDSADKFRQNANATERDLKHRMIEIFGKPYSGDIGIGKPYPEGYDGPDIYRYMYVDSLGLSNESVALTKTYTAFWNATELTHADGTKTKGFVFPGDFAKGFHDTVTIGTLSMQYPTRVSTDNPWPFVAAFEMGQRDTPGEIQIALGDVIQNHRRLKSAQLEYRNLLREINRQVESLNERQGLRAQEIKIKEDLRTARTSLNAIAGTTKGAAEIVKAQADSINTLGSITASALPKIVGVAANDVFSVARAQVYSTTFVASKAFSISRLSLEVVSRGAEAALKIVEGESKRKLESVQFNFDIGQKYKELERTLDKEALLQVEMVSQEELLRQSIDRYQSWIAKGFRVMEDRLAFRKRTAATVQSNRYRDMTFRITRNDALQKYHAQFDLAARYVYLAAKAYDYEVNLLGSDNDSGQKFLSDIVKYRSLGQLVNGVPVPGRPGLADALGRMTQNFSVLKSQLGINNPQKETGRFSLRSELFRISTGDSVSWQDALNRVVVKDLWQIPEFRRYCRPFAPPPGQAGSTPQPGLVIAFPTKIQFGQNFFGWDLSGGDSAYDPSQFATKIHSVGIWFENYDGMGLSLTPRVYLIPVGMDIMRSPSGDNLSTRQWRVMDQVLPEPFPISANQINNPDFIPIADGLGGSFIDIRRFAGLRAYHDSGFNESQMSQDSRLIGRSVWNTQWMLIIPGGTLLNDPNAGLKGFIDSVSDIKLLFRTYSYSGN